jgi:hypothetical protein
MGKVTRKKIWRGLLTEMNENKDTRNKFHVDDLQLEKWAGDVYKLNGRQIRNVIYSAWLLARHDPKEDGRALNPRDIENSLDSVMQFVKMVKQVKDDERDSYLEKWN